MKHLGMDMIYYVFSDRREDIPWKADIIRHYRFCELKEFVEIHNSGQILEEISCMIFLLYTNKDEAEEIERTGKRIEACNPLLFYYGIKSPEWAAGIAEEFVAEFIRKRPEFS